VIFLAPRTRRGKHPEHSHPNLPTGISTMSAARTSERLAAPWRERGVHLSWRLGTAFTPRGTVGLSLVVSCVSHPLHIPPKASC